MSPTSEDPDSEPTCHWKRLTPDVIERIASKLHHNEVAMGLKLVDRSTRACLSRYRGTLQLARELPRWLVFPKFRDWKLSEFALADQPWPARSAMTSTFIEHFSKPDTWRGLTLRQRRRLVCLAASSGDAASLDLVLERCGCAVPHSALIAAVLAGDVRACERLLAAGCDMYDSALEAAVRAGPLEVCRFLVASRCPLPGWPDRKDALGDLASTAVRGGREQVLAWMEAEPGLAFGPGEPFDRRQTHYGLVSAAAEGGHVALMEALQAQGAGGATAGPQLYNLESIAYGCPLEVLQRYWARWVEGEGWEDAAGGSGGGGGDGDGAPPPLAIGGGGTGRLLAAAGASPTPDWAQKLEWIRAKRPSDTFDWIHNWNAARKTTMQPNCRERLERLAAVGVDLNWEPDLDGPCVASAGHADALALLLDATSQTLNDRVVTSALEGCGDGDAARQLQTLQLIGGRGFVFGPRHVAAAGAAGAAAFVLRWLAESVPVAGAAAQDGAAAAGSAAGAEEAGGADAEVAKRGAADGDWSVAFSAVARGGGADLALLRYLAEVRGAEVDLVAIALAGSEEALDWGAQALQQAGLPLPVWTAEQAWALGASGNRATLDWVLRRGLAPAWPDAEYALEHFRFTAVQAWLVQGGVRYRLTPDEWRRVVEATPWRDQRPQELSRWQWRWLADCWVQTARATGGAGAEADAARVVAEVELAAARLAPAGAQG